MSSLSPNDRPVPWDRLDEESAAAFDAFAIYRGLGPDRSLSRVATELIERGRRSGKSGTVRKHLGEWSKRYRWVERVTSYDRQLDRERQARERQERAEMHRRHAQLAEGFLAVLALPVRAIMEKLQRNPDLLGELSDEDVSVLLSLAAQASRAVPPVVAVEREARGTDDDSTMPMEVPVEAVDRVAEEERLRRVALIMHEHGLLPRAGEAAPPGSSP
jgi:hypothetical protein